MVCPCGRPQIFFIKEQIYPQAISWANNPACFIAGTLVLAKEGKKAIESIEPGDKVLAYDEATGDMQYKKVARVFRNTTDKWYHLTVDGEEIVCTPLHPFYVVGVGFKHAKDLRLTDLLLTSQGNCAKIQSIVVEKLSTPEVTYNFEVEDFHTYFVGNNPILVHNACVAKDGDFQAIVNEINEKEAPHAHILRNKKRIAKVDINGKIIKGSLEKNVSRFVSKHKKEIIEGIKHFYPRR